ALFSIGYSIVIAVIHPGTSSLWMLATFAFGSIATTVPRNGNWRACSLCEQALAKTRPQHNNNRKPHPKIVDKVSVAPQNRYLMTARAETPQARAARLLRRETDLYCLD